MAANVPIVFSSQNRANADLASLRSQMNQLRRSVRDNTRETTRNTRAFNAMRTSATSLRSTLTGLRTALVGLGVLQVAQGVTRAALTFDSLRRSIDVLTETAQEASVELREVRRLSRLPGITIEGASRAVIQLRGVRVEGARAHNLIEQLGNALALTGATDLSGLTRAFAQIISRGKILQEEINQITERAPILARALQDAFGSVTAEGIRDAVDGDIGAFIQQFTDAASRIGRVDADAPANVFQNFGNALREAADTIGRQFLPQLTAVVRRLTLLAQNTQTLTRIGRTVSSTIEGLSRSFQGLLVSVPSITILLGLSKGFRTLGSSITFATDRSKNANPAMTRLTGRLFLLSRILSIIGVAFAAFEVGRFVYNMTRAGNAADDASNKVERLTESISALRQSLAIDPDLTLLQRLTRIVNVEDQQRINQLLNRQVEIQQESLLTQSRIEASRATTGAGILSAADTNADQRLSDRLVSLTEERRENEREINRLRAGQRGELEQLNVLTNQLSDLEANRNTRAGSFLQTFRAQVDVYLEQARILQTFVATQRDLIREGQIQGQDRVDIEKQVNDAIRERLRLLGLIRDRFQEQLQRQTIPEVTAPRVGPQRPIDFPRRGEAVSPEALISPFGALASQLTEEFQGIRRLLVVDERNRLRQGVAPIVPSVVDTEQEQQALQQTFNALEGGITNLRQAFETLRTVLRDTSNRFRIGPLAEIQRPIFNFSRGLRGLGTVLDDATQRIPAFQREQQRERDATARAEAQALRERLRVPGQALRIGATFLTDAAGIPSRLLDAQHQANERRLDIERDLQEQLEEIRNNAELSARQRVRRIADAEQNAAQRRRETERQLSDDKREAYVGFIQDALRNLAQLVAAEIQAAIVRATVANIARVITPGLAALGTGGSIGLGLLAVGGLQVGASLLASSFHSPGNDAAARSAGFRQAQEQLFNNPSAFGQQSGGDLVREYDRGFQEGVSNTSGAAGAAGNRQTIVIQLEGRTLAEVLIDLQERNEIPSLA